MLRAKIVFPCFSSVPCHLSPSTCRWHHSAAPRISASSPTQRAGGGREVGAPQPAAGGAEEQRARREDLRGEDREGQLAAAGPPSPPARGGGGAAGRPDRRRKRPSVVFGAATPRPTNPSARPRAHAVCGQAYWVRALEATGTGRRWLRMIPSPTSHDQRGHSRARDLRTIMV
eukprot:gene10333-biopygen5543